MSEYLTIREKEVAKGISEGLSNLKIADGLYIAKRTVDFHIANMFKKFRVHNRVELLNELRRLKVEF